MIAAHLAGVDLAIIAGQRPQIRKLPKNYRPVYEWIDVLPDASNPLVVVTHIAVNGRDFAVHPGWNRLPVRLRACTAIGTTGRPFANTTSPT